MPDAYYPNYTPTDPDAQVYQQDDGRIRVAICDENKQEICRCWVLVRNIAIGKARTGMGGISYVSTDEEHRMKGLGRRLMIETNRFCQSVGMGLIMLYGIPNYYPKFGYAVCGPEYRVEIENPDINAPLPAGWSSRMVEVDDLRVIRAIYKNWLDNGCCGAHDRESPWDPAWLSIDHDCLQHNIDECYVVCSPEGIVQGYAWHCRTNNFIQGAEEQEPHTLVWGEVMALNHSAADAVIAVCQQQMPAIAALTGRELSKVTISVPPHGAVASALRWGHCRFRHDYQKEAWFMSRCANVKQLLSDMLPEFNLLVRKAGITDAELLMRVNNYQYGLSLEQGTMSIEADTGHSPDIVMSSGQLSQLVLGAYSVEEMYSRQMITVSADVLHLCQVLFPRRFNHVFVQDRF